MNLKTKIHYLEHDLNRIQQVPELYRFMHEISKQVCIESLRDRIGFYKSVLEDKDEV